MRAAALLVLTLPTSDDGADAVRAWWAERLQLVAHEDVDGALDLGELAVAFGSRPGVKVVSYDDVDLPQRLVDPAGTEIEVVAPDRAAADLADRTVRDFIDRAEELPGPPVDELADAVAAVVGAAADQIAALMAGVGQNKVLATQFTLSRRGQAVAGSPPAWPLFAASTLMSGVVVAGSGDDTGDDTGS